MNAKILLGLGSIALCMNFSGCERPVSYAADVQPLLDESCGNCHDRTGEGSISSGFSVNDYDAVMKGTNLGKVVVPGSSESSNLYRVIAGKTAPEIRMPPHHHESWSKGRGRPLSPKQIDIIRRWIDQGAKDN